MTQPNQVIPWTDEQVALLRDLWPGHTGWEVTRRFYLRFGVAATKSALAGKARRLGLAPKKKSYKSKREPSFCSEGEFWERYDHQDGDTKLTPTDPSVLAKLGEHAIDEYEDEHGVIWVKRDHAAAALSAAPSPVPVVLDEKARVELRREIVAASISCAGHKFVPMAQKPSIDEIEKILNGDNPGRIRMAPDGSMLEEGPLHTAGDIADAIIVILSSRAVAVAGGDGMPWPFVETPGEFTQRLARAMQEFLGNLLAAVRSVLIENPATVRLVAAPPVPAAGSTS